MFSKADVTAALNANKDPDLKFRWLFLHAKPDPERSTVCVELEITGSKEPSVMLGYVNFSFTISLKWRLGVSEEGLEKLKEGAVSITRSSKVCINGVSIGSWPSPHRLGTYLPVQFYLSKHKMFNEFRLSATLEIRGRTLHLPEFELRCDAEKMPLPYKGLQMQPTDHPERR